MKSDRLFEKLNDFFNSAGFNIVTRAKTSDYVKNSGHGHSLDETLKGGKSIILAGFAGNKFWHVLRKFLNNYPEFEKTRIDWIDDYTELTFESAAEILDESGVSYRMVFPFGKTALDLDFMKLGRMSGVGVDSLLGVLLHPDYGPWISLRGAIITNLEFSAYDSPLKNFSPCRPCAKPCITVCPAKSISDRGWNWGACMDFRLSGDTCENNCVSRRACPYGTPHQYTDEQLAHHHKFVLRSVKLYRTEKSKDDVRGPKGHI